MIDFTVTTEIERPVGEVFAYATDPSKLATWQTNTVSVVVEDGQPLLTRALRRQFGQYLQTLKELLEREPTSRRSSEDEE